MQDNPNPTTPVGGSTPPVAGTTPPAAPEKPLGPIAADSSEVKETVVAVMKTVFDPEIPVNIYELGMVYDIAVHEPRDVVVKMTLTSPACPVAGSLPGEVQAKVAAVPGVTSAKVNLVWDPPWHPDMMSEAAKLTLGF